MTDSALTVQPRAKIGKYDLLKEPIKLKDSDYCALEKINKCTIS